MQECTSDSTGGMGQHRTAWGSTQIGYKLKLAQSEHYQKHKRSDTTCALWRYDAWCDAAGGWIPSSFLFAGACRLGAAVASAQTWLYWDVKPRAGVELNERDEKRTLR